MQLEAERKAFLPKLEEVKAEMAELNRIRYWTRKVIPEALPRVSDGRVSVEDAVETAVNRKELEQVINDAEKNALRQSDDPLQTNKSAPIPFPGDLRKNPFLSHLDSLPQTPYNKREKSIPRRVFEAIQMKREAGSNPAQQPLLYSVCVCHEPLKAISRRRRT